MEFTETVGILYDTLFYHYIYFNKDALKNEFSQRAYPHPRQYFSFFEEVYDKTIFIDPLLEPLFIKENYRPGAIIAFFMYKYDWSHALLEHFFHMVRDNFCNYFYEYYFSTNLPRNKSRPTFQQAYDNVKDMDIPQARKHKLTAIFFDFNQVVELLISSFIPIYDKVLKLHKENQHIRQNIMEEIGEKTENNNLRQLLNFMPETMANAHISISLIHKYIVAFSENSGQYTVLLSPEYRIALPASFEGSATFENFLLSSGDAIAIRIMNTLLEYGTMDSAQMAYYLNINPHFAARTLSSLLREGVVRIARYEGTQVYYALNGNYFEALEDSANSFFKKVKERRLMN